MRFGGGGAEVFGEEASPPVDRTLVGVMPTKGRRSTMKRYVYSGVCVIASRILHEICFLIGEQI